VRDLVGGLAIVSALCVAAGAGIPIALAVWRQEPWLLKQYEEHFAAVVGMPACALLAFLLVVLLEARYDRVEIEFFGIVRFRGAAGPIILWAFCFFIMACGVKMLW
jgi:ABC-type proline/glycine betaine transport system permease subunit